MKSLNYLTSSLIFLLATLILPAFAKSKLAVVDLVRVYQEYSLVKEANNLIDEGEEGLKRVVATAEAEIKKLGDKDDDATIKKREEIQAAVDDKVDDIHDLKDNYNLKINGNIQKTIEELAVKKAYTHVFDKSYMVYAADDITDELLTALEKIKS